MENLKEETYNIVWNHMQNAKGKEFQLALLIVYKLTNVELRNSIPLK
jgi:hypothetical protein